MSNEAFSNIAGMLEEITRKLGEARQDTEELAYIVGRLWDLVKDAQHMSRLDPDYDESFNELKFEYYDKKLTILTPRAEVAVGVIGNDCVISKPVIECVKQYVAENKAEMATRVLKQLSEELYDYFDKIMELIQKTFMKISDLEKESNVSLKEKAEKWKKSMLENPPPEPKEIVPTNELDERCISDH